MSAAGKWFRVPKPIPGGAKTRLFVFHHAGGSAAAYAKWRDAMPEGVELVVAELPGRGARFGEPAIENFAELLPKLHEAFLPELARCEQALLLGHSLGSLLAFEVYRSLDAQDKAKIQGLALSSLLPPTEAVLRAREKIADLPDEEFLEKMKRYSSIPNEVLSDPALRRLFLGSIRSDFRLMDSYVAPPVRQEAVRAKVFRGDQDFGSGVTVNLMSEWDTFVKMDGPLCILPGGHFFVFEQCQEFLKHVFSLLR